MRLNLLENKVLSIYSAIVSVGGIAQEQDPEAWTLSKVLP